MKYFVSGHRDLTRTEFLTFYAPCILDIINMHDKLDGLGKLEFHCGNYEGCDQIFMDWMKSIDEADKVYVHVLGDEWDEWFSSLPFKMGACGYANSDEADCQMTTITNEDIAYVRAGKEDSYTAKNILRRYTFYKDNWLCRDL